MRDTAEWYRAYAETEARGRSASYEHWALAIADDPEVIALLAELPETKRQPPLVFAAARMLGAPVGDYTGLRAWLLAHWAEVRAEAGIRLNQANEPGRCAALLPALAAIPGPLALLEVGASAGLCLYPDRYSYSFDGREPLHPLDGPSEVMLDCRATGTAPIPDALPEVVWRAGIDLDPLDVNDADDRRWLEMLVPPEQEERRQRIRAAAEIARQDPPLLVRGQATDALAGLAEQAPTGATLVLITSGVLVYLPYPERMRFVTAARELVARELQAGQRGASWLSLEGVAVLPQVRDALPADARGFVVAVDERPVAYAHPHGRTLEWID